MTYEERGKTLCNNCEAKENCSYISRNLERNCSFKETTMYGWELGYKDATNKARQWLLEQMFELNAGGEIYVADADASSIKEFIDNFKQAMEEQL